MNKICEFCKTEIKSHESEMPNSFPENAKHTNHHYGCKCFETSSSSLDSAKKDYIEHMEAKKSNYRYVWLDLSNGKFSNSWDEETAQKMVDADMISSAKKNNFKLIKYQCLTDDNFEFYNQMKLK